MRTNWEDEVKDQDGTIIQVGTKLSAKNMNNIEERIEINKFGLADLVQRLLQVIRKTNETFFKSNENSLSIATIFQKMTQTERSVESVVGETINVTLTNTKKFPFNNSDMTVTLSETRDSLDYQVVHEIVSGNQVGDVVVYDKQTNGFKVKYTGSASSADIRLHIRGGMIQ